MRATLFQVHTDVRLHPEIPLVAPARLMHLRGSCATLVPARLGQWRESWIAYARNEVMLVKGPISRSLRGLQRNILAGIITIGPLFVTYLIFSFLLQSLAKAGLPAVRFLAAHFHSGWFDNPWLQPTLAVVLTLVMLYVVGRVTSLVIGRQLFGLFESILERLPFVAKVYTSVRQLLDSMMAKKDSGQRVVLIDFPIVGQKSIGFLTRTFSDATSGRPLAAVLVPNAINPTSAFLQILPTERVVETQLTMEQAMSMILTGGAVGPETIHYAALGADETTAADTSAGG